MISEGGLRPFMYGKLHRVVVTGAELNYAGSITIDPVLLRAAGLIPYTQVDVVNISNGARLQTYIIEGHKGKGSVCLNGAAAHHFKKGDLAIIMGYEMIPVNKLPGQVSRTVRVDTHNRVVDIVEHVVPSFDLIGDSKNCREAEIYENPDRGVCASDPNEAKRSHFDPVCRSSEEPSGAM